MIEAGSQQDKYKLEINKCGWGGKEILIRDQEALVIKKKKRTVTEKKKKKNVAQDIPNRKTVKEKDIQEEASCVWNRQRKGVIHSTIYTNKH